MDSNEYFPNDFKKFSPFNLADPVLWKAMRCTDEKIYKIAKSVQQMEIEDVMDHHEGHINIIICGDHGVGKKSFKTSFNIWRTTQSEHNKLGLRFKRYCAAKEFYVYYENHCFLSDILVAPSGKDHFHYLIRSEMYKMTPNIIMICFALDDRMSFENIQNTWINEINKTMDCHGIYIIVGMKSDLRDNPMKRLNLVTYKEACLFAKKVEALCYLECSPSKGMGIEKVYLKAFELLLSIKLNKLIGTQKFICSIQ